MKSGKLFNYVPYTFDGTLTRVAKREPIPKIVYSAAPALGHDTPLQYMGAEGSERVTYTLESLRKAKLTPKFRGSEIIQLKNVRTATMEEIRSVHSRSYILSLMRLTAEAKAAKTKGILHFEGTELITPDSRLSCITGELTTEGEAKAMTKGMLHFKGTELTPGSRISYVTGKSLEESMVAVGTGLSVVDSVVEAAKLNDMPPTGFALIRPPGNHAVPNARFPMGFCVLNNIAIAARYAQRVHGLNRVFIIDFDIHHGNGTSDAFYDDPNVFYLSTHQDVAYKRHTGKIQDIGCGNGEGTTLNVPLPKLTGDVAMLNVFNEVIIPATEKFKPDIILVSAGYNGHVRASDSEFQMTTGGYYMLASKIQGLSRIVCGGRCVVFLEGGIDEFTLADSVVESFRAFLGDPSKAADCGGDLDYEPALKVEQVIKRIKHLHSL